MFELCFAESIACAPLTLLSQATHEPFPSSYDFITPHQHTIEFSGGKYLQSNATYIPVM